MQPLPTAAHASAGAPPRAPSRGHAQAFRARAEAAMHLRVDPRGVLHTLVVYALARSDAHVIDLIRWAYQVPPFPFNLRWRRCKAATL